MSFAKWMLTQGPQRSSRAVYFFPCHLYQPTDPIPNCGSHLNIAAQFSPSNPHRRTAPFPIRNSDRKLGQDSLKIDR